MVAAIPDEEKYRHQTKAQLIAALHSLEKRANERTEELIRELADRRRAESALRESEMNLREILEKSPIGVAIDAHSWRNGRVEGKRLFANEALVRMFGGSSIEQMITSDISGTWIDVDQLYTANERMKHGIELVDFEARRRRMDGEDIWISMNTRPCRFDNQDCTMVWHFDVTERKQAEQALRENETLLRLIIDSLPVLITYLDTDFRYLMVNKTAAEWYGRPAEEIIGHQPEEFFGSEFETWRSRMEETLRGDVLSYERQTMYADGVTRDVRVIYVPHIDANGHVSGFFSLVEDITETKKAEDRLRQSQKLKAIGQVTGGVAHEFNNMLMGITGNLELLLEDDLSDIENARNVMQQVLKSAFHGKDLISHMLSYTGNPFNRPEIVDVGASVAFLMKFLRPALGETIAIETGIAPDTWPVYVDPGEFDRALTNLAINARDAMPDGGVVRVSVTNTVLDESFVARRNDSLRPGHYVRVSVSDSGTGMTPEIMAHAFDPFYTTKEVGKGTGLGLSMIYGFVRRQSGGHIDIESREGDGTTVTLYLPRAETVDEEGQGHSDTDSPGAARRTALLVEDDESVCDILANVLDRRGYTVLRAADGAAAMAHLDAQQTIDLLLTDVILPGQVSGVDIAEHVRENLPDVKVVLISGYADDELAAKGVPKDRYPLLSKPFRNRDLLTILEGVFAPA